jgi:hypothetical protein
MVLGHRSRLRAGNRLRDGILLGLRGGSTLSVQHFFASRRRHRQDDGSGCRVAARYSPARSIHRARVQPPLRCAVLGGHSPRGLAAATEPICRPTACSCVAAHCRAVAHLVDPCSVEFKTATAAASLFPGLGRGRVCACQRRFDAASVGGPTPAGRSFDRSHTRGQRCWVAIGKS